jgi:hypothetical protein
MRSPKQGQGTIASQTKGRIRFQSVTELLILLQNSNTSLLT